ncbi:hypothetical protein ACFQH5_20245 [Halomonas salifodinae]|uniref:Portal protein n=1 Tax=Halomonas salifodinae TaxID=438745 RepID=A0ABW2F130_9GAMM
MMEMRALKQLSEEELLELMAGMDDEELEELKDAMEKAEAERVARLDALGNALAQRRAEAIAARHTSGIEEEWLQDEEFYEGIDDANRGENAAWSSKPPGQETIDADDTSSTIFLNVTGTYCDAASASLADMLLPTDDSAWQLEPTPVAELIPFAEGDIPPQVRQQIASEAQGRPPEEVEAHVARKEQEIAAEARRILDEAKDKAGAAQKRIEDWHVECQYHAEVRKVIEDAAKVGSGVLKGPFPMRKRHVAYVDGGLVIQEEIKPVSKRIDYRNLYPDGGCGDSIHNGSFVFERDDITEKQLRELIGSPGYDEGQILAVLDEGPAEAGKVHQEVGDMRRRETKSLYEIWYYHGDLKKDDLESAGCECDDETPDTVPAQITMVNNRVIKATMNPLDTGEFPYDVMVWKKRNGMPWGVGIARLIRTPQRMINGAARNLMDNAGLAGGPMWAFKPGILEPMDGVAELAPRKGWIASEDADLEDLSRAFSYFKLDMMVNELQAIIYLGLKMAEDVTGLPMIMQGQMGAQKLDTLGQTQLLNNNANIVRRRIARLFDDLVTEPHVRRYYAYLLQYGEDDEKGEFVIDARGSSNLVERAVQKEKTMEWLQLSQNPIFGIDPKRVAKELLRADKFDPKAFEFDDEEWREIVTKLSQPQDDAGMQAKMAQLELKQAELQAKHEQWQVEEQRKAQQQQFDQQYKAAELQSDQEIARQKMASEQGVTLAQLEAKLGIESQKLEAEMQKTSAQLQNQRDLEAAKLTDSQNERQARRENMDNGYDSWG